MSDRIDDSRLDDLLMAEMAGLLAAGGCYPKWRVRPTLLNILRLTATTSE